MTTHTMPAVRVVAGVACTGLVIASAGFGAMYAWTIGSQHGVILASLTVLFAMALELVKPLAIHGAIQAIGSWRTWPRAIALSVLGSVAVVYSLTAELSLTASSRGDLTAKRQQASDASVRATESHQRAKAELATLKPSRPTGELEALVESARPVCRVIVNGEGRQTVCNKPAALVAELGRAKRKAELEAILERSEGTLAATPAVKTSDPGSAALATYLASLGVVIPVGVVAQWLNLVPVLALEFGSALAMVLVHAVPSHAPPRAMEVPAPTNISVMVPALPPPTAHRDAVARLIVNHLESQGGSGRYTERGLATLFGADRSTIRRTIQSLALAGVVGMQVSKRGTELALTGASANRVPALVR